MNRQSLFHRRQEWMRPLSEVFISILRNRALGIQEEVMDVEASHTLEEVLVLPAELVVTFYVQLHHWEEQQ